MSDVMTPAQRARYEGLLTAVTLAYLKGRDPGTLLADSAEFQVALMELVDFLVQLGWNARVVR